MLARLTVTLVIGMSLGGTVTAYAQPSDGAILFESACATCHNGASGSRAPARDALAARSPEAIVTTLVTGTMRVQGSRLNGAQRRAIAEFLTGRSIGGDVAGVTAARCQAGPPPIDLAAASLWNGWSPTVTNTRLQTSEHAGLTAVQVPRLTLKWSFGFPDVSSSFGIPTLIGQRLYIGSQNGHVYLLDAKTGCVHWTFAAKAGVRTAINIGPRPAASGHAAYFGDYIGNAYAIDAETGQLIWERRVDDHPLTRLTGSATLYGNRLYMPVSSFEEAVGRDPQYGCCTFRGSVVALDAATGAIVWKTYMVAEEPRPRGKTTAGVTQYGPSGSAVWVAPTIDVKRGLLYVATGNNYTPPADRSSDAVVALELTTGRIAWMRQFTARDIMVLIGCAPDSTDAACAEPRAPDWDFGNAAILTTVGGRDLLVIGQKSGIGYALDPEQKGEVVWQYGAGEGGSLGGMEWGSAVDEQHAYFPLSDINRPTPGGLHAVDLTTGRRRWLAPPPPPLCPPGPGCNAAQSAAITVIPGVIFSGSNDGGLRAYSAKDGSIVWAYDTNREFDTVNKVRAYGASIIGPGPVVAGGMVYVGSGYGNYGARPGNVLLAFGVE